MALRSKIDTLAGTREVIEGLKRKIDIPAHIKLDAKDYPFFNNIIDELPKHEWTQHRIEMAALLARYMNDLQEELILMRQEGTLLYNSKGTAFLNPRRGVIASLASTIMGLRSTLTLNIVSVDENSKQVERERATAKAIEAAHELGEKLDAGMELVQ